MPGLTNFAEEKVIRALWRGESLGLPDIMYVGLMIDTPTEAGTGTEVSEASYERQPIVRAPTASSRWAAPASGTGVTSNLDLIVYPEVEEEDGWGLIVARAIFDAATGGNMWTSAELTTYRDAKQGDILKWQIGSLVEEIS